MSLYFDSGANRSLSNLDAEGEEKFTDKQDTLVSGENIKTINGVSVLGEGNIEVGEGGTITVNQTYDPTSSYAQSGTAVADALANSIESITQNGTISNCILEIPQNIKVTLENNVLTAKAGCIFVLGGNTYSTTTNSSNLTLNIPTTQGRYVISPVYNYSLIAVDINQWSSGNTLPAQGTGTALRFFKTDERTFYSRGTVGTEWVSSSVDYPICIIDVDSNGVASFAKFSDGRDCIFNGIGFVGQTKFIYPNVKVLEPIGKNADGTLKSREFTNNSLQLVTQGETYNRKMYFNSNSFQITASNWIYHKDENLYYDQLNVPMTNGCIELGNCFSVNGIVTDFTIRQPYEGVRNLLTDELQADVTTLTGYDATKTQTLKNINGVLQWVTD